MVRIPLPVHMEPLTLLMGACQGAVMEVPIYVWNCTIYHIIWGTSETSCATWSATCSETCSETSSHALSSTYS